MDILTQGLLGGVMAQALANKAEKKLATLVGVTAGLLADADILIRSSSDPLLTIEYHRHFSHSLFFIPFGAAIAFAILWPFLRQRLSSKRLYIFCLAGYSLSGLLDACTSYGTVLFWPFSDERVALNIISIIDPLFTVILLMALVTGLRLPHKPMAVAGLVLCAVYLGLGSLQLHRAENQAQALRATRHHVASQTVVKPTLGNLLLWRSVYVHDDRIYVDAIRVGVFSRHRIYEGESVPKFTIDKDLPMLLPDTLLYADIQRFLNFSNGFVGLDPTQANVLGDIRYSMLPTSAKPLWGIVMDRDYPQAHSQYRFFRKNNPQLRQRFIRMVLGR